MRIISLLSRSRLPVDFRNFTFDRHISNITQLNFFRGNGSDIAVIQIDHLSGMSQKRGNIARNKVLPFADPDNDRTLS